jgi:N-acetylmuramic acid 6-phosphate etherase
MATSRRVRVVAPTEGRNTATTHLDTLDTIGVLQLINAEDAIVPGAVAAALPQLAEAVDLAVSSLRAGGRLHYFGAGSSGRYAILDAAEIPPTYGYPPGRIVAHLAGGADALMRAAEQVEDDEAAGRADSAGVKAGDVAIGLSASGRTPYVAGGLRSARQSGASTVLVSNNPAALLTPLADIHVVIDTGPEAVTGSTRMKAGTAQKMVLHSFSTAVMVRLGRTYSNLMIDVAPNSAKLRARQVAILEMAAGVDEGTCAAALENADGNLRVALVSLLLGLDSAQARTRLAAAGGDVRAAVGHASPSAAPGLLARWPPPGSPELPGPASP